MKIKIFALTYLSAFMLAMAFWVPAYFSWTVFLFLVPLFYSIQVYPEQVTGRYGLWWGTVFYAIHGWGIVQLFYEKAHGQWRIAVAVFILMYCAVYGGLWFFIASRGARFFRLSETGRLAWWCMSTGGCFIFMQYYAWFPTGMCIGYCFANPLLPLAYYHQWFAGLTTIPASCWLWLMIIGALVCAVACVRQSLFLMAGAFWVWAPFWVGWFMHMPVVLRPNYLRDIYYLAPPQSVQHPLDCAQEINDALNLLIQKHPNTHGILMPESAFPFALNEHDHVLELWCLNSLPENAFLLLGTYRIKDEKHYNSLYCVNKMRLRHHYDKNLLMPLTESLPKFCKEWKILKELFLGNELTHNGNLPAVISVEGTFICSVRICAELYFDNAFKPCKHVPVLCLVNDSWFSAEYMRQLMYLFAKYQAMAWHNELIYISHTKGIWIAKNGVTVDLS